MTVICINHNYDIHHEHLKLTQEKTIIRMLERPGAVQSFMRLLLNCTNYIAQYVLLSCHFIKALAYFTSVTNYASAHNYYNFVLA